jgi:hypothetical protein
MFGTPQAAINNAGVFHTVWTYVIKALDGHKKAWFACDGSPCLGQAHILDETYANYINKTSSCMFYGIVTAENFLFIELMFLMHLQKLRLQNRVFTSTRIERFTNGGSSVKSNLPSNQAFVIPILSALQGHPVLPHLWEKHTDATFTRAGPYS